MASLIVRFKDSRQRIVVDNLFVLNTYVDRFAQKVKHKNLCRSRNEPGTSCTQSGCVTSATPSQLRVSIVVKLFNCFDAMGQNVNKRSRYKAAKRVR